MSLFRKPPPPPPQRKPHPDGRVEAQLQRVLSLYAAVSRTEHRIEDIRREQSSIDTRVRENAAYPSGMAAARQAVVLRQERRELEEFIRARHEEITKLLADLGEDAAFLGGF